MPEESNIMYQLGVLSGKMDGVLAAQSSMSSVHLAHATDDNKRFGELHTEMEKTNEEVSKIKERQMLWAGGLAVGSAALSIGGQFLLSKIFG